MAPAAATALERRRPQASSVGHAQIGSRGSGSWGPSADNWHGRLRLNCGIRGACEIAWGSARPRLGGGIAPLSQPVSPTEGRRGRFPSSSRKMTRVGCGALTPPHAQGGHARRRACRGGCSSPWLGRTHGPWARPPPAWLGCGWLQWRRGSWGVEGATWGLGWGGGGKGLCGCCFFTPGTCMGGGCRSFFLARCMHMHMHMHM